MSPAVAPVKDVTLMPRADDGPLLGMIERVLLDPLIDVTKLEQLEQMYERAQNRAAVTAFNASMATAQKAMRPVAADATNPQTRSRYASYEKLDSAIRPIYTDNGFGLSFDTDDSPKGAEFVRVLCYVTHAAGYSKTYKADLPADGKGAKGGDVMTKTHAVGAAMSYGMRYLLKMIFNIAVGEDDRDGNQVRSDVEAPTGFEDWFTDMEASLATSGWREWSEAWNKSKPDFRGHLAKTNAPKIDEWKRKARQNDVQKGGK